METLLQQPYNMFAIPQLTKPVGVYDPNQGWSGKPAAKNIATAFNTPQAKLQMQQQRNLVSPQIQEKEAPIDSNSSTAGMDYLNSLYTDPEEEKRLRKASVMNQRILAIGDAIRHIGNIASTVNYAPAQQLNSPVAEEQARYERGKALRDRANQQYYTYMQAKAAQDRAMAKMEMDFKFRQADDARKERLNDARVSRYNAQNSKDAANQAYWDTRARLLEEGWPLDRAIKEARKAQIEAQTRLTTVKANQGGFAPRRSGGGGGQGGKYWAYDENGNIHYYPNKSMYEQGVYEFGQGQTTTEEYSKGKDVLGREQTGQRKRSVTSMGGERARQARDRNNSKSNPYGDNTKKGNTQKNHKSNPYG